MNSISKTAEDVTHIPTAKQHNVTASSESALTPESTSDRGRDKSGKTHSFSNSLAKEIQKKKGVGADHGAHEALVLKYLANRVAASKNDIGGKKWFYIKIKDLRKHYPYLKATALWLIVKRLQKHGYCEIANYNKYKYDQTFWYHVPKDIGNKAEEELRYFNTEVAVQMGVPGAVLVENFRYWMDECSERDVEQRVRMSPRILEALLPFSERTIKRSLKQMENGGYCTKLSATKPVYGKGIVKSGPDVKSVGPEVKQDGPYVKPVGPDVNDDTYCKTNNNVLETCSKGKPAASSLKNLSGVEETNSESVGSSQVQIPHDADEQKSDAIGHDEITSPRSASPSLPPQQSSPATLNVPGFTGNMKGMEMWFRSFKDVHMFNRSLSTEYDLLRTDIQKQIMDIVFELSEQFLKQDDPTIIDWTDVADEDELYDTVKLKFIEFMSTKPTVSSLPGSMALMIFGGTLETIIGALSWDRYKGTNPFSHGIYGLQRTVYTTHLIIFRVLERERQRLVDEEFTALRRIHATPDVHKENDEYLAPAEKTRVFRNALDSRNKVGWIDYLGERKENIIRIEKKGLSLIQRLFEHNEDATPADLLKIMDRCIQAYKSEPKPPRTFTPGVRWSTRIAATSVFMFANLLPAIVREQNITQCPIKHFLGEITKKQQEEPMALAA